MPFLDAERVHALLGFLQRILERAQPLAERLELALLQGKRLDIGVHHLHKGAAIFLHAGGLVHKLIAHSCGGSDWLVDVLDKLLDAPGRLFPPCRLLQSLVQLADLHVHVPDQLVHVVGLNHGPIDDVFLPFEHLGLLAHALGQPVQRDQLFLGRPAQFLQMRKPPEFVLHLVHSRGGDR